MKITNLLCLYLLLSLKLFAGSVTATYSAGDIPTTLNTSVTTGSRALEPGLLTVTIPVGSVITSVNVVYNMTATSLGYMSEQRSFIRCTSTLGTDESAVYSGGGNSSGTYAYNRTNLTIANNVSGGGNIQFELHAFRIYGASGSNITYNYVNNNSWQITVNYDLVNPPTNLVTIAYTTQIRLSWTKNAASNNVIIAYNTANTFGTPINGTSYPLYGTITGGGTIIYSGSSASCYHLGLNPGTPYYYQIWSVNASNNYSSCVTGNTATLTAVVNSIPVVSNVTFVNNISATGYVDIYYNVADAEQSIVAISIEVSNDGGTTYNFACTQVTGDIGSGISVGNGKHIIWNFSREHGGEWGTNFKIKIIADDLVGDQIYYAGQIYHTVTVGNQVFLKENLNVGTRINGSADQTNNGVIEKYCYNDLEANCTTYGGLYQWAESVQYLNGTTNLAPASPPLSGNIQGICPSGWHIPTHAEYDTLRATVNNTSNPLLSVGQGTGAGAGTNTSGFSALLAGDRYIATIFANLGTSADLRTSTEADYYAWDLYIYYNTSGFGWYGNMKTEGFSVRCLKD